METAKTRIPHWIYSLSDYRSMFDLSDALLNCKILDFPGGLSSFNAEMRALGYSHVISADSHYNLSPMDMIKHADFVVQDLSESMGQTIHLLRNNTPQEAEVILGKWRKSVEAFLKDYSAGQQDGRYHFAELPTLPFANGQFELALCSELLFHHNDYSAGQILQELCRVAQEVRVFPLLDVSGEISKDLGPVMLNLQQNNLGIEVKEVPYNMRRNSNAMLKVWIKECVVA